LRMRRAAQQTVAARQITRGRHEIVARSSAKADVPEQRPPVDAMVALRALVGYTRVRGYQFGSQFSAVPAGASGIVEPSEQREYLG
jgi:hypothetical protein